MGPIHTRKRMHLFLHFAGLVMLLVVNSGCQHFSKKLEGEKRLANAMNQIAEGQYDSALAENLTVLEKYPRSLADQAHFQIGLIYAHPENPGQNYQKSLKSFDEILKEFPQSRLKDQAQIWVLFIRILSVKNRDIDMLNEKISSLEKTAEKQRSEINLLQDQIEKLKRVDLGIEEKKEKVLHQYKQIEESINGEDSGSR